MKIAIIGTGNVGNALGANWKKSNHEIIYGSRNPQDKKHIKLEKFAQVLTLSQAAIMGDVIVLATPWQSTQEAINEMGSNLDSKIVIDATNPLKPDLSGLLLYGDNSGGEQIAKWASKAKVVKALNSAFAKVMEHPEINGVKSMMLIAGDDASALNTVAELVDDLGFQSQKMNGLSNSRLLEMVGLTLITLGYKEGLGNEIGLSILKN
ncbi:MAG: putative dinucleotide-binding enzyme [Flavobacteriaceae bacterium]|jgi:predicted dinucleotide-binding enzyme